MYWGGKPATMLLREGTETCVNITFHLSITYNIGAGMDKEDIYQNKKHMRGGEDFSPVVGQTWVWLTPSQWNSHLSINQWKQRVCQSFTRVSFNISDLLTCKWSLVPTNRILKEVLEIIVLTYNSNGGICKLYWIPLYCGRKENDIRKGQTIRQLDSSLKEASALSLP